MKSGELRRFLRGIDAAETFDRATMSPHVSPGLAISFDNVFARPLVIGPRTKGDVSAGGLRASDPEKALVNPQPSRLEEELAPPLPVTEPAELALRLRSALMPLDGAWTT